MHSFFPFFYLKRLIARDGHFFVVQDGRDTRLQCCGMVADLTVPETLDGTGCELILATVFITTFFK